MVLIRNGSTNGDVILRCEYRDMWREKFSTSHSKEEIKILRRKFRKNHIRYEEYIKSKSWKKRKRHYFSKHKKRCTICNTRDSIELHHVVYGRLGKEKDSHLAAVCQGHHREFHEKYGSKGNMTEEWLMYIEECKS